VGGDGGRQECREVFYYDWLNFEYITCFIGVYALQALCHLFKGCVFEFERWWFVGGWLLLILNALAISVGSVYVLFSYLIDVGDCLGVGWD
jgi:hypothetical protein